MAVASLSQHRVTTTSRRTETVTESTNLCMVLVHRTIKSAPPHSRFSAAFTSRKRRLGGHHNAPSLIVTVDFADVEVPFDSAHSAQELAGIALVGQKLETRRSFLRCRVSKRDNGQSQKHYRAKCEFHNST
jgi:hypothetical protein